MEYIVVKKIPRKELKSYENYIGSLFINENGVYNICETEEDIRKSNQWFNNLPVHSILVTDGIYIKEGDNILVTAVNEKLNGNTYKYNGYSDKGEGLVSLTDKNGEEILTTIFILDDAYKVLRPTNIEDKRKIVNGRITPILK